MRLLWLWLFYTTTFLYGKFGESLGFDDWRLYAWMVAEAVLIAFGAVLLSGKKEKQDAKTNSIL